MNWRRHFILALIIAVSAICAADDRVIYNHVASAPTSLDKALHERFAKRYEVVDFSDKDHSWVYPRGLNPSPTPPAYREGVCIAGQALVAFVIRRDGTVGEGFAVQSTNDFLGSVAVGLAEAKRFAPGQLDGQPVSSLAATNFRFTCPQEE